MAADARRDSADVKGGMVGMGGAEGSIGTTPMKGKPRERSLMSSVSGQDMASNRCPMSEMRKPAGDVARRTA